MKRLTKKIVQQQATLADAMQVLAEEADEAVANYNEAVEEAFSTYQDALARAHSEFIEPLDFGCLEEANAFCQDIASQLQDYYDDRSERWQEGDAGEQYQEWINTWGGMEVDSEVFFEMPEPEEPDSLDVPEIPWEEYQELPDSP